ncbi:MAG: divergent PAP2 family protein [Oscillospiraceae bacterium]|nr:divergent PAP2 family protein [Oscillospiraceae bacterium]
MFNYVIVCGALSWLAAQILKTIFHAFRSDKVVFERLIGAGGMPSSHTALVISSLIAIGRTEGTGSSLFGLAFMFSAVVIYDAMNVRHAAGLHAKELNTINRLFNFRIKEENSKKVGIKELNEFLGHTPLEVLGGAVVGTAVALLLPLK